MEFKDVILAQASLEKIFREADRAVSLFYGRLFDLDPALRALFSADFAQHGRQFLDLLHLVIAGFDAPEMVIPTVKEIGRRHAKIGIRPEHYYTFGEALLWMVEQIEGGDFTKETGEAWMAIYYLTAGLMKEACNAKNNNLPDQIISNEISANAILPSD